MAAIYAISAEVVRASAASVLIDDRRLAPQLRGHLSDDRDEYDKPKLYRCVEIADRHPDHPTWYVSDRSVALHSLEQVGVWKIDYRRRSSHRQQHGAGVVPPSHIDRTFEAELSDVMPNVEGQGDSPG